MSKLDTKVCWDCGTRHDSTLAKCPLCGAKALWVVVVQADSHVKYATQYAHRYTKQTQAQG